MLNIMPFTVVGPQCCKHIACFRIPLPASPTHWHKHSLAVGRRIFLRGLNCVQFADIVYCASMNVLDNATLNFFASSFFLFFAMQYVNHPLALYHCQTQPSTDIIIPAPYSYCMITSLPVFISAQCVETGLA